MIVKLILPLSIFVFFDIACYNIIGFILIEINKLLVTVCLLGYVKNSI